MKVLDTFAGAGGFSLGFENAGYEIIGAIEKDAWACDTFRANHPEAKVLTGFIEDFSDQQILDTFEDEAPEVVLGGPPCQGFSKANNEAGDPKDPRNSLFEEFVRVGELLKPKLMVMENVPKITETRTESGEFVIEVIRRELRELGYYVYDEVLEAVNYGVPQIRERLFVIASEEKLKHPFPEPTHYWREDRSIDLFSNGSTEGLECTPTLSEAISDLPEVEAREGSEEMEYTKPPENEYQEWARNGSDILFNHTAMNHYERTVERFKAMSWGDSVSDVPDEHKPYKRGKAGKERSENAYDQNNRRMHPHRPCHTIPASFYSNFVHPFQHRNFTPREGARLQSFTDDYVFKGKPTRVSKKLLEREGREAEMHLCQYNQIGNAVPPLVAKAIGENLISESKELNARESVKIVKE